MPSFLRGCQPRSFHRQFTFHRKFHLEYYRDRNPSSDFYTQRQLQQDKIFLNSIQLPTKVEQDQSIANGPMTLSTLTLSYGQLRKFYASSSSRSEHAQRVEHR